MLMFIIKKRLFLKRYIKIGPARTSHPPTTIGVQSVEAHDSQEGKRDLIDDPENEGKHAEPIGVGNQLIQRVFIFLVF